GILLANSTGASRTWDCPSQGVSSCPDSGQSTAVGNSPAVSTVDTGGEFPKAADQPESGQDGDSGGREARFPDGPDEFAPSVSSDTGGELPWAADGPDLGQDGATGMGKLRLPPAKTISPPVSLLGLPLWPGARLRAGISPTARTAPRRRSPAGRPTIR